MRKYKRNVFYVWGTLLLAFCLFIFLTPAAFASVMEETFIPMSEPSLDSLGYVAISADPPVGFEGILCIELQHKGSSQTEIVQISGLDYYAGGAWLKEGTYLVKDAYVLDSDHFFVTCSEEDFRISHEDDAVLYLTVTANQEQEAQRDQLAETFEPGSVPTFPMEDEVTEPVETTSPNNNRIIVDDDLIASTVTAVIFFLALVLVLGRYLHKKFFE